MTRKHEANIKKSKWINIQLGIIAFLSFTYFMYEVKMYAVPDIAEVPIVTIDDNEHPIFGPVIPEPKHSEVVKAKTVTKTKTFSEVKPIVVEDDTPEIEPIDDLPEEPIDEQPKVDEGIKTKATSTNIIKKGKTTPVSKGPHTALTVDFLPVFPGCDRYSSNNERAKCFQKKVQRLINKKFNDNIGEELGISGKQRIMLYFEIDEKGDVTNINARSLSNIKGLEEEAKRVANLLPKMEPARAGKRRVKMSYSLPISFVVQ